MHLLNSMGISGSLRDAREVVGLYKRAQVLDADAVYSFKLELLDLYVKPRRRIGWIGLFMTIGLVISVLAIFMVPFFIWMVPYGFYTERVQRQHVESGTAQYCLDIGIASV